MSICVLLVAFEKETAIYPANPVLPVFTVVQTFISLTGFIVFILLEEKKMKFVMHWLAKRIQS